MYKHYKNVELKKALAAISKGMTYTKASEIFNISKSVLYRHKKNPKIKISVVLHQS